MEDEIYVCEECDWEGPEEKFISRIMSILYRPRNDSIQAFTKIKCPKCDNMIRIYWEDLYDTPLDRARNDNKE